MFCEQALDKVASKLRETLPGVVWSEFGEVMERYYHFLYIYSNKECGIMDSRSSGWFCSVVVITPDFEDNLKLPVTQVRILARPDEFFLAFFPLIF